MKTPGLEIVLCRLLVVLLAATTTAECRDEPLPIEALAKVKAVGTIVQFSPDGQWIAFTIQDRMRSEKLDGEFTRSGTPSVGIGSSVWVINTRTGDSQNLTPGQANNWGPSWSPDGKYLAFYSDRTGKAQLWIWGRSSGQSRAVSDLVIHPYTAMETARWTQDSTAVIAKILPEGMAIEEACRRTLPAEPRSDEDAATTAEGKSQEKNGSRPTVVIYRSYADAHGPDPEKQKKAAQAAAITNAFMSDLALIDVSTGKALRLARDVKPCWYEISPSGNQLAFVTEKGWDEGDLFRSLYDLVVVSMRGDGLRVVASNIESLAILLDTVSWSPDGKMLSYTDWKQGTDGECYLVSVEDGQKRRAAETPHPSFGNAYRPPLWDASGQSLYFIATKALWKVDIAGKAATEVARIHNKSIVEILTQRDSGRLWSPDGGRSIVVATQDDGTKEFGFYRVDLITGARAKLREENKVYRVPAQLFMDVSADGSNIAYVAQDISHPDDLWITDPGFINCRRLSNTNPQIDRYQLGSSRLVEWTDKNGNKLRGALLLPPGYRTDRRYPLIVDVYGGDSLSDSVNRFGLAGLANWTTNKQLLATRGYAVLLPDTPLRVGSPMSDLASTVLPAVDKVIEMGIADPERLGVMGASYGGYSTLALIVQTTRFRAAVIFAGFGDLISAYGEMSDEGAARMIQLAEKGQLRMGGTPWQFRDRYIENSPIFYLDRVQTPALIVHGTDDHVARTFLGDEIFVGLRRLGKEAVYARYEGEGHALTSYANIADYLNRMILWFDQHLSTPAQK
ncbi:MAG TPA: prolyl oligopeptidase family serine peptidase [Blastocatellia bacterium]|nr:prolyl oligopeptidase family serine peptidase [Blastocatellia bacterium]